MKSFYVFVSYQRADTLYVAHALGYALRLQAMNRSSTRAVSVAVSSIRRKSAMPFPVPTWCWR